MARYGILCTFPSVVLHLLPPAPPPTPTHHHPLTSSTTRLTSVLCFAQSLFLLFAAVYISKEAIEQVLLGAGAHDHGGHGHGHGEPAAGDER